MIECHTSAFLGVVAATPSSMIFRGRVGAVRLGLSLGVWDLSFQVLDRHAANSAQNPACVQKIPAKADASAVKKMFHGEPEQLGKANSFTDPPHDRCRAERIVPGVDYQLRRQANHCL
jgi:hypothetical protein